MSSENNQAPQIAGDDLGQTNNVRSYPEESDNSTYMIDQPAENTAELLTLPSTSILFTNVLTAVISL